MAPATRLEWAAPSGGLSGSATATPEALALSAVGPGFRFAASADTSNPYAHLARAADSQAQATHWGAPRIEGFSLEGSLDGVDLMPLADAAGATGSAPGGSGGAAAPRTLLDGSPLRLRLSGSARASARRDDAVSARRVAGLSGAEDGSLFSGGGRTVGCAAAWWGQDCGVCCCLMGWRLVAHLDRRRPRAGRTWLCHAAHTSSQHPQNTTHTHTHVLHNAALRPGPLALEGVRLNSLSLARSLAGDLRLAGPRLLLRARGPGRGAEELLELDLALPGGGVVGGGSGVAAASTPLGGLSGLPAGLWLGERGPPPAIVLHMPPGYTAQVPLVRQGSNGAPDAAQQGDTARRGERSAGSGDPGGDGDGGGGAGDDGLVAAALPSQLMAADSGREQQQRVSHVLLRRGDLHISSTVRMCMLGALQLSSASVCSFA